MSELSIKRLILVSSFSEILYAKYIYNKCLKLKLNPIIFSKDKIIHKHLLKIGLNSFYFPYRAPSFGSNKNLLIFFKNILIVLRFLIFKFKIRSLFKKYKELKAAYYFGGHCDREIPFIIHELKNLKLINLDYFNWMEGYSKLFKRLEKVNFLSRNFNLFIYFKIHNFLSGNQYRFYLMKHKRLLTIKQKKYKKEKIIFLKKKLLDNISKFYLENRKNLSYTVNSIVVLYHENLFEFGEFKIDEAINEIKYFLKFAKEKGYTIFFKIHPTSEMNILDKYKDFSFQVLDRDLPIEDLHFYPDFFFGFVSSSFKFLNPKKKNLILENEKYFSSYFNSLDSRLESKYLISNKKNIFSNSIRELTNQL